MQTRTDAPSVSTLHPMFTPTSSLTRRMGFPTSTGQEFLEFLRALATSDPKNPAGSPLEAFLGTRPKALTYVQTPKPSPSSFARKLLQWDSHAIHK
jgi:hypothetical protein